MLLLLAKVKIIQFIFSSVGIAIWADNNNIDSINSIYFITFEPELPVCLTSSLTGEVFEENFLTPNSSHIDA